MEGPEELVEVLDFAGVIVELDKREAGEPTERSKPSKIVETRQLDLTIVLPQSGSFRCYVAARTGDISPDEECDRN